MAQRFLRHLTIRTLFVIMCVVACNSPDSANLCNRDCLEDYVNQYLDAIVGHNPSLLPLAENVKFTENGQMLELGDGFWNTASAIGSYKLYVADPHSGQVGFFGTIRESGTPAILVLRFFRSCREYPFGGTD
jgi:hypothetical protein